MSTEIIYPGDLITNQHGERTLNTQLRMWSDGRLTVVGDYVHGNGPWFVISHITRRENTLTNSLADSTMVRMLVVSIDTVAWYSVAYDNFHVSQTHTIERPTDGP